MAPRNGRRTNWNARSGRRCLPISSGRLGRAKIFRFSSRRRGPAAKLSIMCCLPGRPVWENDAGADRRARTWRQLPRDIGAGDLQGRRPRGAPHQSRTARRAVHRRNSPAGAGGRGNSLSGNGGFPARPYHRRRPRRALGPYRTCALHADRRDDAHRTSDDAAARSLRHSGQAQFLRDFRTRKHRAARRRRSWRRDDAGRGT